MRRFLEAFSYYVASLMLRTAVVFVSGQEFIITELGFPADNKGAFIELYTESGGKLWTEAFPEDAILTIFNQCNQDESPIRFPDDLDSATILADGFVIICNDKQHFVEKYGKICDYQMNSEYPLQSSYCYQYLVSMFF